MAELHHGGRLREAAARYDLAVDEWLDLSTGINPNGWPVPALPAACWQRLPELDDGLESAAADYYGNRNLLPVAGSQAAIQLLPSLRPKGRVGMLAPSYAEHAQAWRRAGHEVVELTSDRIDEALAALDVLLLVNPNNPTGECFSARQLMQWHQQLQQQGGWLLVDEAFMDAQPDQSIVPCCGEEGLVVLRSLGKFFGLAGIRVGFAFAWPLLLKRLQRELGPWHVSGPAREVARRALLDVAWQQETRKRLQEEGSRLSVLLERAGLSPAGGSSLFQYIVHPDALRLHESLARAGIFTRLFEQPSAIRFGLPGSEMDWVRLEEALTEQSKKAI